MALIDFDEMPRRQMTLFFLIDTSGSMHGAKIGSVNDAIDNVLPIIAEISDSNPDAEISVAAMTFNTDVEWLTDKPIDAADFEWTPVKANGLTSFGEACRELNAKLSRSHGFMSSTRGCFAPVIILMSDGEPTDVYDKALDDLKQNDWFRHAIKVAIAIGNDADLHVLKDFAGSMESVIRVHNIEALRHMIRVIAVSSTRIGSQSTSVANGSKQEQVSEIIREETTRVKGAESCADLKGDDWDDDAWD